MKTPDETRERLETAPDWIKQFAKTVHSDNSLDPKPLGSRPKQIKREYQSNQLEDSSTAKDTCKSSPVATILLVIAVVSALATLGLLVVQMKTLYAIQNTFKDLLAQAIQTGLELNKHSSPSP